MTVEILKRKRTILAAIAVVLIVALAIMLGREIVERRQNMSKLATLEKDKAELVAKTQDLEGAVASKEAEIARLNQKSNSLESQVKSLQAPVQSIPRVRYTFDQIRSLTNKTQEQVIATLGRPTSVSEFSDGSRIWLYGSVAYDPITGNVATWTAIQFGHKGTSLAELEEVQAEVSRLQGDTSATAPLRAVRISFQ